MSRDKNSIAGNFEFLFDKVIDKNDIKTLVYEEMLYNRNARDDFFKILLFIRSHNESFLNKYSGYSEKDFSHINPMSVFLEIVCFLSSTELTFNSLKDKKVLFIGSNYGMEVLILRAFRIEAFGIEIDETLHNKAIELFKSYNKYVKNGEDIECESIFLNYDILNYINSSADKYDVIMGRNIDPLFDLPGLFQNVKKIMNNDSMLLIQWDAIYNEKMALSLYSPKNKLHYNEKLRELLDSLYIHVFKSKRPRARFLYKMSV